MNSHAIWNISQRDYIDAIGNILVV
jgi:hypothetical protein